MSMQIVAASASGVYQLCGRNSGRPLVQIAVSSDFSGTLVFSKDVGTVSSGQSLTDVAYRVRGSTDPVVDITAGVAAYAAGSFEPDTQGLPLYATIVRNAGTVTLTTLPEWAGTPADTTVTLGNVGLSNIPLTFPEDLAFAFEVAATDAADVSASS